MEAEKRERWMRLCVEAADGQDSKRLLELISEIDGLLHEKEMRLKICGGEQARTLMKPLGKKQSCNRTGKSVKCPFITCLRGCCFFQNKPKYTKGEKRL